MSIRRLGQAERFMIAERMLRAERVRMYLGSGWRMRKVTR